MIDIIKKILAILSPSERRHAYILFGMVVVMAMMDVVGVASIMPFMAVLANPDLVSSNFILRGVYTSLGFADTRQFLFFLGIVVFVTLLASISFKALTTWAIMRFAQMRHHAIARRLVGEYLHQPYEWYLNQHSADLGKMALSEVQLVVVGALMPLMHLLAQGTIVIAMLMLLVVVDPVLAIVVGGGIGGAYGLTYVGLRRLLDRVGKERVKANAARFKAVSEAFGGIKEVKLRALESVCLDRFDSAAKHFAHTQVVAQVAGAMPRFALEIVGFGGILLATLFLMKDTDGLKDVLPIISLYALAGYRLMPALQTAYNNATKLRFAGDALDRLHQDFQSLEANYEVSGQLSGELFPEDRINLDSVTYTYPGADRPAVNAVDLEIKAQTTVGFAGTTGSGKSTTVDVILGLLVPQKGSLSVDGVEVTRDNRRDWQCVLGYVPQHIFLTDETIAANIAFGVPASDIDQEAVERAARIANLHEFVVDDLPNGYDTYVGERGVRLSGGQRQRIGIARALYDRPRVLVLDEATSALDSATEQAVMDAVHNLSGEITIILIAHRLSTLRDCDKIFLVENGKLAEVGSYEQLAASNA